MATGSSFSTIMNEQFVEEGDRQRFIWENQDALIEMQLDHDDASTRAIYARGGRWKDRAKLMQHWADLMNDMRDGKEPVQTPKLTLAA
jgi:hypothetical protein